MEQKAPASHMQKTAQERGSEEKLGILRPQEMVAAIPHVQDDEYQLSMEPIYEAQSDLQSHYSNLNGLVKDVVTRNSYYMKGKFVSRSKREEEKLAELTKRVSQAQTELEHNPTVDSVSLQIMELKMQVDTMAKRASQLEVQCAVHQSDASSRGMDLAALKEELNAINKENMQLSYHIDDLLRTSQGDQLTPRRVVGQTSGQTLSLSMPYPDLKLEVSRDKELQLTELKGTIRHVEGQVEDMKGRRCAGLAEQIKLEGFFQGCIRTARHELMKSQELPRDSRGLQGSLYFELLGSQSKPFSSQKTYRSNLQDRDYKNVVYYTVKRMISTARDERKQQQLAAMDIPVEQLRKYAPMQIIGLLCLRTDVIAELHLRVFPANVLRISGKKEEGGSMNKGRKPSLPKIGGERYIPAELRIGRSRIGRDLREKHSVSIV